MYQVVALPELRQYPPGPPPLAKYLARRSPRKELPRKFASLILLPGANVTLARLVHPEKAAYSMEVTLPGMVTLTRLLHQKKA